MSSEPVVPDYSGACISNIIPAILEHSSIGEGWIPDDVLNAKQVVLFLIDGLGYEQLMKSKAKGLIPNLSELYLSRIHTVAPTTTATALTSLTTGRTPGEHGVIGYKIRVGSQVLNALRWTAGNGSAINEINPSSFQPIKPFGNSNTTVISPGEFQETGFTDAHLRGVNYRGYWLPSSIPFMIQESLSEGAKLVYAYYDGLDKIGHINGIYELYDYEISFIDDLVGKMIDALPKETALIVTADHGMVNIGDSVRKLHKDIMELTAEVSGEARFLWLHSKRGAEAGLKEALVDLYSDEAWICGRDQILDEGWFGKQVSEAARNRLGDVAIVAREPVAFAPPSRMGPNLVARHGSLTVEESYVPIGTMLRN